MDKNGFYSSKAWEKFRKNYISECFAKNGEIICARCGKPIVKPYDCILHHKKHLTDENFMDPSVALNPDNVEPLHMRCHNLEHAKGFSFSGERLVYLVYGPPTAGLVEYVKGVKTEHGYKDGVCTEQDLVVNVDEIFRAVGTGRSQKLLAPVMDVRNVLIDDVKRRRGRWQNAYIIGGYPVKSERERLLLELGAEEIYIEGPETDDKYVKDWFDKYRRTL